MTSLNHRPMLAGLAVALTLSTAGCVSFHGEREVAVSVRDAETGRPTPGARVDVRYPHVAVLNAPRAVSGTTGGDGTTTVVAANFGAQDWAASADGFLADRRLVAGTDKDVRSIEFRLYRVPPPSVVVVVPNGFRGPLMVDRRPTDRWVQGEPGRRAFTFRASPGGYVGIDATPLLIRMNPFAVGVVFEDGSSVPEPSTGTGASSVALRHVDLSGARTLFVVGTEADFGKVRPVVYDFKDGDPRNVSLSHERFNAMFDAARAEADVTRPRR
jgi:hypothetical protein